jgi:polyisoprenoid-binding protein YceI
MTDILTPQTQLPPGTWGIDTAHSTVEFTVRHLGISKVRGRFNDVDASVEVGQHPEDTVVRAAVDLSSVDTNNPDRDAHLRSTDFFDIEAHPSMTFASTAVRPSGDGWVLAGDLTINGTTNPIELDVEFHGAETYPMDQKVHAGFSATGSLSRKAYGVDFEIPLGADKVAIGDKVSIELEIQLVEPS